MEPKITEQLTELTEQELVETEGGFFGFGNSFKGIILAALPIGGPGKTPGGDIPRA